MGKVEDTNAFQRFIHGNALIWSDLELNLLFAGSSFTSFWPNYLGETSLLFTRIIVIMIYHL